jgi:hypothetical protein
MVGSVFKFGADTTEYNKAVEAMPRKIKQAAQQIEANTNSITSGFGKLQNVMASVGVAFSGTIIVAQLRRVMEHFDRVYDLSVRFGTSAESIQRVGEAARLSGSDIDMVARAMTKAGVAATQAVNEGGAIAETFERAGINAREFERSSLDQKLLTVAQAFKAANGDASKQNEILKLIGMRAADLIPLISNVEGLKSAMADASVVSDEAVKKIADANDRLDKLGFQMQANVFAPAIIGATDLLARIKDINSNSGALEKYLRIQGALLTGGASLIVGGKTPEERQREADREQAVTNLQNRGQLPKSLPTDMNLLQQKQMELFIEKEILKIETERAKAKEDALNNQRNLNNELDTTVTNNERDKQATEEKKALMQEIARINLQIKEAQAAGNDALAADLTEFKDLLEAGIKYEGDMEAAARDVNAAYKERLRLKDEEIAKQQASIEAELKHAEAMAFGTDEAKAKAEWMAEYNRRIKDGATDDQARRFANAETYEPPTTTTTGAVGGGSGGGGGRMAPPKPKTAKDYETEMRAAAAAGPHSGRARDHQERGFYGAAGRAMERADKAAQAVRDRADVSRFLKEQYGAGNMGEAYEKYRDMTGMDRDSREEFEKKSKEKAKGFESWAREAAKPEEEKKRDQKAAKDGSQSGGGAMGGSSGSGDKFATEGTLVKILNKIQERPILVA